MNSSCFIGIDVGTGSVRAGVFDGRGYRMGMGVTPIQIFRPQIDFVEQSSSEIWRATSSSIEAALREAGVTPAAIEGIGFDATCSLVALDSDGNPVSLSPTGRSDQNVIVWMDHRALQETAEINATGHGVLKYVGGVMSPEMEIPKILWIKRHLPESYRRAARFLDLPDFLVCQATGTDVRSLCSTTCKWTYRKWTGGWDPTFFHAVGLSDLVAEEFRRIGTDVRPIGECAGHLSDQAARELGLRPGIPVGVSIIDAHAGGLGMLGASDGAAALDFNTRLALIGGTSTCHMAVAREKRFIDGVWGPYHSAMLPDWWLAEGGQSATGALIDHVINLHAVGRDLRDQAHQSGVTPYQVLNAKLEEMAVSVPFAAQLTKDLHVYPDFHGNRSPHAEPNLRGMISGLRLSNDIEDLALLYLATIQGIAHGTREIILAMNASGYQINTIVACGGDTKNPIFLREHADVTGCRILSPREPEAVLLGSAMLGAVASGRFQSVEQAMISMSSTGSEMFPSGGKVGAYHERKGRVLQEMRGDQRRYAALMSSTA